MYFLMYVFDAALRMFGYTRRDMIGRNINVLVPEPMSTVHQQYMLRYISTGREVRKYCTTHPMFSSVCALVLE